VHRSQSVTPSARSPRRVCANRRKIDKDERPTSLYNPHVTETGGGFGVFYSRRENGHTIVGYEEKVSRGRSRVSR